MLHSEPGKVSSLNRIQVADQTHSNVMMARAFAELLVLREHFLGISVTISEVAAILRH